MRRIIRIALLATTIVVSGLVVGIVISRADVPSWATEISAAMLGLVGLGGSLVVALVGSQNVLRIGRTAERPDLDRLQGEFIQNVAHELRTPLTLVRGYVEMLAEEQLDEEERRHAVAIVRARTEVLVELVEAITTLYEVELGHLNLQLVDLGDLARIATQMIQQKAHRAGVRVLVRISPDVPYVTGDSSRLLKALKQLLDNAVKFSPNGGIVMLHLSVERDNVRVEVVDQGIGIPDGKLECVFDRFYQVDGSTTRRFGGIGLGLAIVKAIVEAHGGRVWASSAGPAQGSTFVFTVPVRASKYLMGLRLSPTRGKLLDEAHF